MTDYRSMFDRDYLGAWDIPRDVTVQICKVEAKKLKNKTKENTKPVLYFHGKEKGLACNKTNGKTIAAMYGNDVEKWIGKWITLYATTTTFGPDTVECIRVRPVVPRTPARGHDKPADEAPDPADDTDGAQP